MLSSTLNGSDPLAQSQLILSFLAYHSLIKTLPLPLQVTLPTSLLQPSSLNYDTYYIITQWPHFIF